MSNRIVCNVATGPHYLKGQERLTEWLAQHGEEYAIWNDRKGLPVGSPTHLQTNYAFKAFALLEAAEWARARTGVAPSLLWCDASIIPARPLDELWERIERDGYWICKTGYNNYQWTADLSYVDLFAQSFLWEQPNALECARIANRTIDHVATTAFGISVAHPTGRAIFEEFYRLASTTRAFHGPWRNSNSPDYPMAGEKRMAPCGPPDVLGHRHDQTALSVIAWRLGCVLDAPPDTFAYKGGENEKTILIADGAY